MMMTTMMKINERFPMLYELKNFCEQNRFELEMARSKIYVSMGFFSLCFGSSNAIRAIRCCCSCSATQLLCSFAITSGYAEMNFRMKGVWRISRILICIHSMSCHWKHSSLVILSVICPYFESFFGVCVSFTEQKRSFRLAFLVYHEFGRRKKWHISN